MYEDEQDAATCLYILARTNFFGFARADCQALCEESSIHVINAVMTWSPSEWRPAAVPAQQSPNTS